MEYRTLSQICDRLYLPIFCVRMGLFTKYTYIYIASWMDIPKLCPTMPMILKLSNVVMWTVVHWYLNIGESTSNIYNFLQRFWMTPPMYSSSHSNLVTLKTSIWHCFLGSNVLWWWKRYFKVYSTFEMYLYSIFVALTKSSWVWHYYAALLSLGGCYILPFVTS